MAKKNKNKRRTQKDKNLAPSKKTDIQPGLWEKQSSTTQHAIILILLTVLSFSFFAPLHFGGKSLFAFDTVSFKAMSNEMAKYKEETGETALWSPNPFGGMPGYMISSPTEIKQLDDIPRALRNIIWPSSHFLFLLFGTYLLVYYLVRDKWAGFMAAVAYGFTTYVPVILMAGHNSKFITMAFAPWLVLAFVYALRKPGFLASLLFAMALAINLRAGHVQITYYVSFVMGVWWIGEAINAFKTQNTASLFKSTGWLALGSVLGVMMVAQPYLANFEYKAYTIRGASAGGAEGGMSWAYAMNWSQGWGELITLLISDAYGGASAYWGAKPGTGGPHYVGGIVMVLAIFATFFVKKREVKLLAIAAFIMTLFSLGSNFEVLNRIMYNHFPMFDSFRVPETWLSIVAFVLAILAAYGLTYALEVSKEYKQGISSVLKTMGVALVVMIVLFGGKNAFFEFERPGERQILINQVVRQNNVDPSNPQVAATVDRALVQIKEDRVDRFTADAIRTILMIAGAGLLFFLVQNGTITALIASILIAGLVTIDLYGVGKRYFTEDRLTTESTAEDLVAEYGFDTWLINKKNELGGNGHFRVLSFEGSPTEIARPAFHYETLSGYHGAKLRLYQDYLESILFDGNLPSNNALDLMNVRYLVSPQPLPGTQSVFQDPQTRFHVLEREGTPDRAFFVGETEVIESSEATWARIKDASFDVNQTALLPASADFSTTPLDSTSIAETTLNEHTPHKINWSVNTDADRLMVVSEVYYPAGWKAYIDNEEAPIYRVNYLTRGVFVPAGEHEVEMRFDPPSYKIGYWSTLGSTLIVYGGVFVLLGMGYMRRKDATEGA